MKPFLSFDLLCWAPRYSPTSLQLSSSVLSFYQLSIYLLLERITRRAPTTQCTSVLRRPMRLRDKDTIQAVGLDVRP